MLGANGQRLVPALRKGKQPAKKTAEPTDDSPTLFFGLGVGTGVGYASGTGEVHSTHVVDPAGLAMSRLVHFSPEVGYYLSPNLMLSLQLRYQLITGANEYHSPTDPGECGDGICSPGTYAFAGFGRINYFFGEGDFRTYVAGILGGGTIRHVAAFESLTNCGPPPGPGQPGTKTCVDTVASGPVFVGAGAGIMYNLSPAFALTLGTNALVGFTKFTFHGDLNAGVAFEY
jgi:hypothetical protein